MLNSPVHRFCIFVCFIIKIIIISVQQIFSLSSILQSWPKNKRILVQTRCIILKCITLSLVLILDNKLSILTYGRFFPATTLFCCRVFFGVFGSMFVSIESSRIFMGSRIFLSEVLGRSDFQLKKNFGHFGGLVDPPNLENAPKATKLTYCRP